MADRPAYFCEIYDVRKWTAEQWEARQRIDPVNLRRDIGDNQAWRDEDCDNFASEDDQIPQ